MNSNRLPPQPIKSNSVVITEDIQGERLFEKELSGPESIVLYKGIVFATLIATNN